MLLTKLSYLKIAVKEWDIMCLSSKSFYLAADTNNVLTYEHIVPRKAVKGHKTLTLDWIFLYVQWIC